MIVFFFAGLITGSFILEVYKTHLPQAKVAPAKVIYVEVAKDCERYEKMSIPCISYKDREGER